MANRTGAVILPWPTSPGSKFRNFPAETALLALIIAEYQCDLLYRGQKDALPEFLLIDAKGWITCGDALRLDRPRCMPAHLFLPTYSLDFNPIEQVFAKIKTVLRKAAARTSMPWKLPSQPRSTRSARTRAPTA